MRRRRSRRLSRKRLCKKASSTERGDGISMKKSGNQHHLNRRMEDDPEGEIRNILLS
jgi:hypothetical protein